MRTKGEWILGVGALALALVSAPVHSAPRPRAQENGAAQIQTILKNAPADTAAVGQTSVASLLSECLKLSEAAREAVPDSQNPRLWLADAFLANFRAEMKALAAGKDWAKLESLPVVGIAPGVSTQLDRRTLRSLGRIAAAHQFMARLGIYLNFNSILVEKDPAEVAVALGRLDLAIGTLRAGLERAWPQLALVRHAVYVRAVKELASGVREEFESVVLRPDRAEQRRVQSAIAQVLRAVEALGNATPAANLAAARALVASPEYAVAKKALRNVEIPDSGDIDGDDEALGRVLQVQIGFELVDQMLANADGWMGGAR